MTTNHKLELRKRLINNLNRLIGNPVIEAKELAVFDLIMSRREFLKTSQFAAIGTLVGAAWPPSLWGRQDPALHVAPSEVGLTDAEMASVTRAAQLAVGTELFQDTIYAQPLVSPAAVNTHALIEGASARPRLQSQLTATDPDEQNFLDSNYRWGPAELIQLEQDSNGDWELVHYHHPWEPRTDGVKTDGLVRQVIMTKDDGLVNPTKVITVTGSFTNRVNTDRTGTLGQVTGMSYMVFVEDTAIGNNKVGHLAIGTGLADIPPPYDKLPDKYPVSWISRTVGENLLGQYQGYEFADKYNNNGYEYPVEFDPVLATEFIVLYFEDNIKILTLSDVAPEYLFVEVSSLPIPSQATNARVVHINYDPRNLQNSSGDAKLENVVLATSENLSNGDIKYTTYYMDRRQFSGGVTAYTIAPNIDLHIANWPQDWGQVSYPVSAETTQNGALALDYSSLRDVHTLYKLSTGTFQEGQETVVINYHVKLANFEGRGIVAFTIKEKTVNDANGGMPFYDLSGQFPLSTPTSAVIGKVLAFSGGTSKFDGLRYMASDANGNLFLFRQRRYTGIDSPYAPPIYGNRDGTGQPIASLAPLMAGYLPLPLQTTGNSNLHQLLQWVTASNIFGGGQEQYLLYNILLYAALAFATDDTSQSQAVWLGNSYKAAYAPSRFAHDSEHVVIKQVQNGEDQIYSAFSVFKNPVDKTWRERQIASQMLITAPGQGETGDHYQATVTPVNAYGQPVSMQLAENASLQIEVRADSPCTVTDDTNNYYYDIDRYTSFLAAPDPGSGQLNLVTKAETFSQVLYVRLVDVSALSQAADTALLGATADAVPYAWQSENLALQAQQRMGNGGQVSSLLGGSLPIADTNVYVSGATLAQSDADNPWATKGSYQPSPDNLDSLASYLNTSGQNLISATGQLSDAAPDIDPLYVMTTVPSDPERNTVTTSFSYDTGTVVTLVSSPSPLLNAPPGSIFSSISHALHDALHWLQHVESDVYKDLSSGVSIVSAVDSITATVSKEIMKQVNGVEQDLQEVVNTVEEYASVVANLVVTIVENSFIYKFVELIIELISLFQHFKDVLALSRSYAQFFDDLYTGGEGYTFPALGIDWSGYSSWSAASDYFGPDNKISDGLGQLDESEIITEVTTGLLDLVQGNPMTNKILNKLISVITSALEKDLPESPVTFTMLTAPMQEIIQDVEDLENNMVNAVANMSEQLATTFVQQLSADLANPRDAYQTLADGLGPLAAEIADDFLEPIFDFIDSVVSQSPEFAREMIGQDPYVTINVTMLSDLCRLFGIGKLSSDKVELSASEAVFFPIALISWVAAYLVTGDSIKSVQDLDNKTTVAQGTLGGSVDTSLWNVVRFAVDFALVSEGSFMWAIIAPTDPDNTSEIQLDGFKQSASWFNLSRWVNDITYQSVLLGTNQGTPTFKQIWDTLFVALRLVTACADVVLTLPGKGLNTGSGWPGNPKLTDLTQGVNILVNLAGICIDTVEVVKSKPTIDESIGIAGQDLARTQVIMSFLFNRFLPGSRGEFEYWAPWVIGSGILGLGAQVYAVVPKSVNLPGYPGACLANPNQPHCAPGLLHNTPGHNGERGRGHQRGGRGHRFRD